MFAHRSPLINRTLSLSPLLILTFVAIAVFGEHASADEQSPPSRKILFLDEVNIAEINHLHRRLHQPQKRGAVIHARRRGETIQTRTAPVWDPVAKVYKIWLLSTDRPLWTSEDGVNWSPGPVPNLRTDHVVYDPHDPDPNRRFKAAQTDDYFAVSPDGVQWTKLPVPKVPSSDESNLSYDPGEKLFIHTVKRLTPYGRSVGVAVSRDYQKWDDFGTVFQPDDLDQKRGVEIIRDRIADNTRMPPQYIDEKSYRVDVYNMGVFHYEGLYVGMPAMYHATGPIPNYPNTEGFHVIQLTVSRNLKEWHRVCERATFIGPSRLDSGAYDLTQILPPSAPVVRDDELWFYYTGLKYRSMFHYIGKFPNGHVEPKTELEPDHGAICLAVLRRDGFVSLDADEEEGIVTTKPIVMASADLSLNAIARGEGSITVDLVDADGATVTSSEPISGDGVRLPVRWKQAEPVQKELGHAIQLRVRLKQASLFAINSAAP